jgi:hypothetical protein
MRRPDSSVDLRRELTVLAATVQPRSSVSWRSVMDRLDLLAHEVGLDTPAALHLLAVRDMVASHVRAADELVAAGVRPDAVDDLLDRAHRQFQRAIPTVPVFERVSVGD